VIVAHCHKVVNFCFVNMSSFKQTVNIFQFVKCRSHCLLLVIIVNFMIFVCCMLNCVVVGHVVNVDVSHIKANRHFCNKIWQAFRFFSMNIDKCFSPMDDLRQVICVFVFRKI